MWFWRSSGEARPAGGVQEEAYPELSVTEFEEEDDAFVSVTTVDRDREALRELQGRVAHEREQADRLAQELKAIQLRLTQADKVHARELEFKDRLVAQKEAKASELDKALRAAERAAAAKASELNAQIASGERKAATRERELLELRAVADDLRVQLARAQKEVGDCRAQLARERGQRDAEASTQQQLQACEQALQLAQGEAARLRSQVQHWQGQAAAAEAQLGQAREEGSARVAALEAALALARADLEGRDAELAASRFACEEAQQRCEDLRATTQLEVERLQEQVAAQKQEIARSHEIVDEIARQATSANTAAPADPPSKHHRSAVQRMLEENPTKIPIRCIRAEGTPYPLLSKTKFAVHQELTLDQFAGVVRTKLSIAPGDPLYLQLPGAAAAGGHPPASTLGELYTHAQGADGFLVLKYSHTP